MKRLVVVLQPKCTPAVCNYECITTCPVNNKSTKKKPIWAIKARDITKGYSPKAIINENRCLHERCGICINACPINAITTINVPEQTEDEKPVHKYDDSLFSLYRIPQLSRTRVTGFLGRNAIGKSTVIEILAGRIIIVFFSITEPLDPLIRKFKIIMKKKLVKNYELET
ncbi:MAG: hypothetical protein ACXAC7_14995 [Candidatus Hodarchaeales archaeon]|jgi:ATP-binding cassette subfamily E protein 1